MKKIEVYIDDYKKEAYKLHLRERYNAPRASISTLLMMAAKEAVERQVRQT